MKQNKYFWLVVFFFYIFTNYAITINDVQKLNTHTFFATWSQFLDQVLQAKQEPMSDENETIYKSFIEQAQQLNIPKVTGNTESIDAMQQQIKLIKKRIADENKFFEEWTQFCDSVVHTKQYPMSPEDEATYQSFIKRAKDMHIDQSRRDEMNAKMGEINDKLLAESVKNDPERQAARIEELEKKVEEMSKKLNSSQAAEVPVQEVEPLDKNNT